MSVPGKHSSCTMLKTDTDYGPKKIFEAIELGLDEVAIATPDGEGLSVIVDSSRVELRDVEDEIDVHLFFPDDIEDRIPAAVLNKADSVTRCSSVKTRLIAYETKVYIRSGTLDSTRRSIIGTGYDHECGFDAETPTEFMKDFLTI